MADISVYLQTIREAEKGEAVRDAITDALQAMNLIGGNASTLDGHPASYFATSNLFNALVGQVGEVDEVLEAIENGLNALKYDMGNITLVGEGGTFTVDCTGIKGYDNLDVSKFYFELRGATGSKPSGTWTPTQSYDPATGIFTYTWGAMSADVDVKLWVVKPTKTAIGTAVTELYVTGNGTYDAGSMAAYNPVIVNVPNPVATEILRQEFTRNGHFVMNPRAGYTFEEAIIDVNVDRDVKKLISQTFSQNGVYRAIDDDADGYKVVTINVSPKILIDNKRITSNGRYRAIDDGGDGYVDVQVNVPPDATLGSKSIGKNGTYLAGDDNLDGFESVSVNVPQPVLGSKTITSNGTYDPMDEDPKLDGFNSVTVNVPQTPAALGALLARQNGTYRASQDNYDGYDVVTVDVAGASSYVEHLYDGRENSYKTDAAFSPVELENYNEGTNFSDYISTADHKTFTILQDFLGIVAFGVMQSGSSSNIPNCSFFVNNTKVGSIDALNATSGSASAKITHMYLEFKTGDTFFWGSENTKGYPDRIGSIDMLVNADLSGYSDPTWN